MNKEENKAFKFTQKIQQMIEEKDFSQEQINMILSGLLATNGYDGLADHVAQEYDTRSYDHTFLKGRFESGATGIISFDELVRAVFDYTGRFSLLGLAKQRGRSKTYRLDEEGAKKLTFMWMSSHEEVEEAK